MCIKCHWIKFVYYGLYSFSLAVTAQLVFCVSTLYEKLLISKNSHIIWATASFTDQHN